MVVLMGFLVEKGVGTILFVDLMVVEIKKQLTCPSWIEGQQITLESQHPLQNSILPIFSLNNQAFYSNWKMMKPLLASIPSCYKPKFTMG
jgi:hypothetical protein